MKFIDLFAGIGGFRLGFENQGYECVYSCEIDEYARKVYEDNFGDDPKGDIRVLEVSDIPEFDILLAGFSCQPFSKAGKQLGFKDERGNLFFDIMRIVEERHPKVIVLENVKHLVYHNEGESIKIIVEQLEEEGYIVSYEVLNAKDFGVPQNRERVIIVAQKDKAFDFSKIVHKENILLKDILEDIGIEEHLEQKKYELIDNPKKQKSGMIFVGYLKGKNTRFKGEKNLNLNLSRVHKQCNRIYSAEGIMSTLLAQESNGRYWVLTDLGVRKLTTKEKMRLMGLPRSFKIEGTERDINKVLGNSICVPMVEEIAKVLREQKQG